jgi:hypothetical protein
MSSSRDNAAICVPSRPQASVPVPPSYRTYPGITQEVASNESQRGPKATPREALIYDALFVARWLQCLFEKGS